MSAVARSVAERMFRPAPSLTSRAMSPITKRLVARLMDGLDLLIDFATLGEYGLEELPADGSGREKTGGAGIASLTPRGGASPIGWEVLAPARRSSF
jgi:hypothetical protein